MPPSNLGERVDRHHVGLGGVADRFGAVLEQKFEQRTRVEGGAADEEVVRGRAPGLFQPSQVRLETARRDHHRPGGDGHRAIAHAHRSAPEPPVHDVQPDDLGLVADVDPQALGVPEERVHHGLAAAQEPGIGARQVQRPGERRLEVHPVGLHPLEDRRGPVDGQRQQIEAAVPPVAFM